MHLKGEKIENYTDINLHYFFNSGNGTCGDRNCSGKSIYSDNANASVMVKSKSIFKSKLNSVPYYPNDDDNEK